VQHEVSVHSHPITSVSLVPTDANYVVTLGRDDVLKLVDVRTYQAVQAYRSDSFHHGTPYAKATIR